MRDIQLYIFTIHISHAFMATIRQDVLLHNNFLDYKSKTTNRRRHWRLKWCNDTAYYFFQFILYSRFNSTPVFSHTPTDNKQRL
jgi:hypothetical protein